MIRRYIIALALVMGGLAVAVGQSNAGGSFTLTSQPAYFILGGYSVKAHYVLPSRWSVGLSSEGAFELPESARDRFFDGAENLNVDWDYLVGVEVHYRFTDAAINRGLFLRAGLGYEGWTVEQSEASAESIGIDNWYANVAVGYNYYPFASERFHVGASYSVVFILNETGDRVLGDERFHLNSVVPPALVPNLWVGWRFGG